MSTLIEVNRRRGALLVVSVAAVPTVAGFVIGAIVGGWPAWTLAGLVVGVVGVAVGIRVSLPVVLSVAGARRVEPSEQARLHNLVDGLCASMGLTKPDLCVIDDPALNAFVAARGQRASALVTTTGLLASLGRIELEGVVAQLLGRIRSREASTATLATVLVAWPVLVAERGRRRGGIGLLAVPLVVTAPIVAPVVRLAAPPERLTLADVGACQLTRYPPGLLGALDVLARGSTATPAATAATAHLWLAQPLTGLDDHDDPFGSIHRPFDTYPPLEERIALVREL